MLTLSNYRTFRVARDVRRTNVNALTAIGDERLRLIEIGRVEPWFDEAILIARALCVSSVHMLINEDELADIQYDPALFPSDMQVWRSGARIPLSSAFRLMSRFGLDRVDDLVATPLMRQIWEVVGRNERNSAHMRGGLLRCPWCSASGDHLSTCLPNNLLGDRRMMRGDEEAVVGVLRPAVKGKQRGGMVARGLLAIRTRAGLKQREMAEAISCSPNHYARVERGAMVLSLDMARRVASRFGIDDIAKVYAEPAPDAPASGIVDAEEPRGDWLMDLIASENAAPDVSG